MLLVLAPLPGFSCWRGRSTAGPSHFGHCAVPALHLLVWACRRHALSVGSRLEPGPRLDAKLGALAAAGPARESAGAVMQRRPTHGSIGAAEERLGEISSQTLETFKAAMARAF